MLWIVLLAAFNSIAATVPSEMQHKYANYLNADAPMRLQSQQTLFLTEYSRFVNQQAPLMLRVRIYFRLE